MAASPYDGLPSSDWLEKTQELVNNHPLDSAEIVEIVLKSWSDIFKSKIGPQEFVIGKDILPQPQIMGFLLHELIPLEFESKYPKDWCRDRSGFDKDLISKSDETFSIEIKTSSGGSLAGNRSYTQPSEKSKKNKSGYYLVINFDPFKDGVVAGVKRIRFGWLEHSDWIGQAAASGQSAHLKPEARKCKLVELYSRPKAIKPRLKAAKKAPKLKH